MNKKTIIKKLVLGMILWMGLTHALWSAEFSLNRYFSHDMVIQRNQPIVISGGGDPGKKVSVNFSGKSKSVLIGEGGRWSVELEAMEANKNSQSLKVVSGHETILKTNILIGDVILHARQAAIDVSLESTQEGKSAAEEYQKNPWLRHIGIETIPSMKALNDLPEKATDGWKSLDRESALKMTASAFYIGRKLVSEAGVPVGVVDLKMGSAFPISWLSREELEQTEKYYGRTDIPGQLIRFDKAQEKIDAGEKVEAGGKSSLTSDFVNYALCPSGGYNASIAPLKGMAFKAILLQLGNDYPYMVYDDCINSDDPFNKEKLNLAYIQTYDTRKVGFRMEPFTLPRVPKEWRNTFGNKSLPMGLILPPASDLNTLGQHHREMRELQRLMAKDNKKVNVIVPGYENVRFSAQTKDEVLLAERCLQWLRADVYKKINYVATGPMFDRVEFNFNEATVYFKEGTAQGLKDGGDALSQFEVAGVLGDYSSAKAIIDGDKILLESETVNPITRVRFNWKNQPSDQLTNKDDLPAVGFRSDRPAYHWYVKNSDDDLPLEYTTSANEWPKNDVTLINGQLKTHGYMNFTGWVGPVGLLTGPFGPNMGVRKVKAGSPAEGKIFFDDIIYSANGEMLGKKAWEVMSKAITASETHKEKGKLVLGVRRGGKNINVELTLKVMGKYSPRAPFDCPKTEKIISDLDDWMIKKGARRGFLNYDAIYMLATGKPELQGYVRRIVYEIISKPIPKKEIDPRNAGKSWHNSAEAFLLGEYYMATGDKNVLGHLKHATLRLAASQHPEGGWRHNFPGGDHYGLIPNAGLPGVLGMHFATEAGLEIDHEKFNKAVNHFEKNRTETGWLIYGVGPLCEKEIPVAFDPKVMGEGGMSSCNGGLGASAILMKLTKRHKSANFASLICSYAWNSGYAAHGGDFWGNFWTPLGAYLHGEEAFIHYWKNRRWIRELNRMHDGGLIESDSSGAGAACGVALVAPRKRIQITGAPGSPFSINAPKPLAHAVKAYKAKEYQRSIELVEALIDGGTIGKEDIGTIEYLAQQARDIQLSIDSDINLLMGLIKEKEYDEARSFLPGLRAIMAKGDSRLQPLEAMLEGKKSSPKSKAPRGKEEQIVEKGDWVRLVSETFSKNGKTDGPVVVSGPKKPNEWKLSVIEDMSQASKGWEEPSFDDSEWSKTELPVSWRMYHTALLRTTFKVEDKERFEALRLYAWVFRQQGIKIYLNGNLIGKINNLEKKTGNIESDFQNSAMKHLKDGENTLAITTRHNWRWGMLFMKVYNDGFDFNLDARLKK